MHRIRTTNIIQNIFSVIVFVSDTVKSNPLARLFANEERSLGNGKLDPYSPIDPLPANQGNLVLPFISREFSWY
jgi:hypothetical protein